MKYFAAALLAVSIYLFLTEDHFEELDRECKGYHFEGGVVIEKHDYCYNTTPSRGFKIAFPLSEIRMQARQDMTAIPEG